MAGYARRLNVNDVKVIFENLDETSTVNAGADELTNIIAPDGYIYQILNLYLYAPDPSGSTSGEHKFNLYIGGDTNSVYLYGGSNSGSPVILRSGVWELADWDQRPPTDSSTTQMMQNLIIDSENGLDILYQNDTDANQTADRRIRILYKKIRVD